MHNFPLLTDCNVHSEKEYNSSIAENNNNVKCLDGERYDNKSKMEPCDLITVVDGKLHLIHVKISTRSSTLSHLFNQGVNSAVMLRRDSEVINKK